MFSRLLNFVEFDEHDIKKYTWKDRAYYKLYQRDIYKNRLGVRCICENCEKETTFKYMKNNNIYPDVEMLLNQVNYLLNRV